MGRRVTLYEGKNTDRGTSHNPGGPENGVQGPDPVLLPLREFLALGGNRPGTPVLWGRGWGGVGVRRRFLELMEPAWPQKELSKKNHSFLEGWLGRFQNFLIKSKGSHPKD